MGLRQLSPDVHGHQGWPGCTGRCSLSSQLTAMQSQHASESWSTHTLPSFQTGNVHVVAFALPDCKPQIHSLLTSRVSDSASCSCCALGCREATLSELEYVFRMHPGIGLDVQGVLDTGLWACSWQGKQHLQRLTSHASNSQVQTPTDRCCRTDSLMPLPQLCHMLAELPRQPSHQRSGSKQWGTCWRTASSVSHRRPDAAHHAKLQPVSAMVAKLPAPRCQAMGNMLANSFERISFAPRRACARLGSRAARSTLSAFNPKNRATWAS